MVFLIKTELCFFYFLKQRKHKRSNEKNPGIEKEKAIICMTAFPVCYLLLQLSNRNIFIYIFATY